MPSLQRHSRSLVLSNAFHAQKPIYADLPAMRDDVPSFPAGMLPALVRAMAHDAPGIRAAEVKGDNVDDASAC